MREFHDDVLEIKQGNKTRKLYQSQSRGLLFWNLAVCSVLTTAAFAEAVPVPAPRPVVGVGVGVKGDKDKPKDDKNKDAKEEKAKGPNHSVTLAEELGVLDLLKRAQAARILAEKDPTVWPKCVGFYADILRKYPNTVYLDRWEGPSGEEPSFKNGLYKSTRQKVAHEIASLPEKGIATYQLLNDPSARSLFNDAQEQFSDRKMEQVAQEYFCTSYGDDALLWLSEIFYHRGSFTQSMARLGQIAAHPNADVSKSAILIRYLLSQVQTSNRVGAEKTLAELNALPAETQKALRVGHESGSAAIEKLKQRIEKMVAVNAVDPKGTSGKNWTTYFGNAAHNQLPPKRNSVGILKWSEPIVKLLYGPQQEIAKIPKEVVDPNTGQNRVLPETQNQHLTSKDGLVYLCDGQIVAAYPQGNPKPGTGNGGNAKFLYPPEVRTPPDGGDPNTRNGRNFRGRNSNFVSVRHHPYFCTIGDNRLFVVQGPETPPTDPQQAMWGGNQEVKVRPNHLIALKADSGKLEWSLESNAACFSSQSKADQEWLKTITFVGAPTYESGMIYAAAAIPSSSTQEIWVVCLDAENGRILWRTSICAANPIIVQGPVQLAMALPITVSNGNVFICTNLGAVGTLDAVTGAIKWIRVYERMPNPINPNNGWNVQQSISSFWGPNPPIVYNNFLIVTPQDSEWIYAFYIETDPNQKGSVAGKRAWDFSRTEGDSIGKDLRHVLGISNGYLFLSGNTFSYFDIKSGKKVGPNKPLFDGLVKGRGVVTEHRVFLPTDKALVSLEIGQEEGRISVKAKDQTVWANPAAEAGNVCIAGDVLFTVSHTHVNAYFVFEEMETKLLDRIKAFPQEAGGYIELSDTYVRVDQHAKALAILEDGLKNAVAASHTNQTPQSVADLATLLTRKFEVLFALGDKALKPVSGKDGKAAPAADPVAAYDLFKQALEVGLKPNLASDLPVNALVAMAETLTVKGDVAGAVWHYHEILEKYSDVNYVQKRSTFKARLYAQTQIEELKKKDAKCYAKIDALAQDAFNRAGDKPAELEALLRLYPNADLCAQVLIKLAQNTLETMPDQSRNFAQRFLRSYHTAPEAALMNAVLCIALERLKSTSLAREILVRLARRKEYADKTIAFDPTKPKVKLSAPQKVSEWAETRLKDPLYLSVPSVAQWSLGTGKLAQVWTRPITTPSNPLQSVGTIPLQLRNCVFYVENQELHVMTGGERGDEIWTPRPKLPTGVTALVRGYWAENLLIIFGEKECVAYDSANKGNVVWRKNYIAERSPTQNNNVQVSEQRIVISYPNGLIEVVNSATGTELWRVQIDAINNGYAPMCGEGFVAVVTGLSTPNKILFYTLETGALRGQAELTLGLLLTPVVAGDRLYCIDQSNKLHAFDGQTCKLQWEHALNGAHSSMQIARELLMIVEGVRDVKIFPLNSDAEKREFWQPSLPTDAVVKNVFLDSDDLYVMTEARGLATKARVLSYSVKSQGKFQWSVDISNESLTCNGLNFQTLSLGHLILTQSNWDPSGAKPSSIVLVNRRTGKLEWDTPLSIEGNEGRNAIKVQQAQRQEDYVYIPPYNVQLFEGGLVFSEGKKRVSFGATDKNGSSASASAAAADLPALLIQLEQNNHDVELRIKVANAYAKSGAQDKAIAAMLVGFSIPDLSDEKFTALYDELSRLRRDFGAKVKPVLSFIKIAKAPAMDGTLTDWATVSEKVFDTWNDVTLSSEEDGVVGVKKPAWKGATDLKVSFRGAYDEKNLYVLLVVTDDIQKNEQTEASQCDLGDSVRLLFDMDRDGGLGWRGEDYMLGAALNKNNQAMGWRWVESGRFLRGDTSLKTPFFVVRKEAEKQTIYQFSLPLETLKIKPENGRKFGCTFVVNDKDEGLLDKNIKASAGGAKPPSPGLFGEGVLLEK